MAGKAAIFRIQRKPGEEATCRQHLLIQLLQLLLALLRTYSLAVVATSPAGCGY